MSEQNSSGNSVPSPELNYSYTPGDTVDTTADTSQSEPLLEDDSTSEVPTAGQEEAGKPQATQQELESAKRLVINTVEDKLRDLANGKLTGPALKQWFLENPEIADVASRAKRVKDAYRTLVNTNDEIAEDTVEQKTTETPLTRAEMMQLLEERETKTLESRLSAERIEVTEQFAKGRQILDGDYDRLKSTAEALYKANPDWEYKDALEASQRALFPTKSKPIQVPVSQNAPTIKTEDQTVDDADLVNKGFTYQLPGAR